MTVPLTNVVSACAAATTFVSGTVMVCIRESDFVGRDRASKSGVEYNKTNSVNQMILRRTTNL